MGSKDESSGNKSGSQLLLIYHKPQIAAVPSSVLYTISLSTFTVVSQALLGTDCSPWVWTS